MGLIFRQWLPLALVLLAFPLAFGIAGAQDDEFTDCREQVAAEIDKLQVKAYVKHVSYYTKWVGLSRSTGVNAWVSLDNCHGDLVIEMNRACEVVEAYGHGDCGRLIPTTYAR